jgi:hypothetical protein
MHPNLVSISMPISALKAASISDEKCIGGVFSDCSFSPVTNVAAYSGSVENQVFYVFDSNRVWSSLSSESRAVVGMDGSLNALSVSLDGSVTACAVTPSDEGSEIHVIRTPSTKSSAPLTGIKIFETPLFPIRTVCFGMNGKLKTKIFAGTDEGKVLSVSLTGKSSAVEIHSSPAHGGVKCVRTCGTTGHIAASFCDGFVVHFDGQTEVESRKILPKSLTPDNAERFGIDWHPKGKILAIAGLPAPVFLKIGAWATTPIGEAATGGDKLSTVKWSLDGALIAGVTITGAIHIWEYSAVMGPSLLVRCISDSITVVNVFWGYENEGHVVNGIDLRGARTSIDQGECSELKRALKLDLATLAGTSKEAAVGHMESGLEVEHDDDDSSSDSSSDSSQVAESVDESPEQLAEELRDLVGVSSKPADVAVDDDVDEVAQFGGAAVTGVSRSSAPDYDTQFSFQPGSTMAKTIGTKSRRILCWNQNGWVVRTDFDEEGLIEVHLELEHVDLKQFRLRDSLHGWSLASLGTNGLALGVKSKFDMNDKYEEEDDEELLDESELAEKKKLQLAKNELTGGLSKVCFRPFAAWGAQREWILALPQRAEIESIAAGATCVAAIATDSAIRVWSNEGGFLLWTWNMKAEIPISIAANGDLFFVVSAMRSRSTESVVYETFLTQHAGGKLIHVSDGTVPVSGGNSGTALCWVGVSEDFVPFTCDTQGIMRGLYPVQTVGSDTGGVSRFMWVPLLNFVVDAAKKSAGYWPVFVSERDVWCVATKAEDDFEPKSAPIPGTMHIPIRPQGQFVASDPSDSLSPETQLMLERLVASQARLKALVGVGIDPEQAAKKSEISHDKKLAETFRKLVEAGKIEKALGGAALAFTSATSRLMIRMSAALGLRPLESRLEDLFNGTTSASSAAPTTAAETLFPQAAAPRKENIIPPPMTLDTQQCTKGPNEIPITNKPAAVNPFAKKRKAADDQGLARNA